MRSYRLLAGLGLLAAAALAPITSQAKTFVVDGSGDESALGPSPQAACPSVAGSLIPLVIAKPCTLRAAIETAQDPSDTDPADVIQLTVEGVAVESALPIITKNLTIQGALESGLPSHVARLASVASGSSGKYCYGSSNATTDYPLFIVNSTGAGGPLTVNFQNLIACFGKATTAAGSNAGGAIRLTGSTASFLNLTNVQLVNNSADFGGALSVDGGAHSVLIRGSSFSGNHATSAGGGAYLNSGTVNIIESTVGPYFATGSALASDPSPKLPFSADGNISGNAGGGIFVGGAKLILERSFVAANTAGAGAAIAFGTSSSPAATLIGNTIARNVPTNADATGVAIYISVSSILPATDAAPFVGNLIAENGGKPNCSLPIGTTIANSGGYNMATDSTCFADVVNKNQVQTAASPAIFWINAAGRKTSDGIGGFATRGLLPSVLPIVSESAAVDKVLSDKLLSNNRDRDARGAGIADGNLDGTPVKDIGAYELGAFGLAGFATQSGPFTIAEPGSGDASFMVPVKNFGGAGTSVTVAVKTVDISLNALPVAIAPGTALPDAGGTTRDYAPASTAAVTMGAGGSDTSTAVVVHHDTETEPDETVRLLASGLVDVDYDALTTDGSGTRYCQASNSLYYPCVTDALTITDSLQAGFQFQISSLAKAEGDPNFAVTVFRRGPTTTDAYVTCYGVNGTAVKDSDFLLPDQVLHFAPGVTSMPCYVGIVDDSVVESAESFTIGLRDSTAGLPVLTPGAVTVAISDNDSADSTLRLSQSTYSIGEKGGSLVLGVQRNGTASTAAVSVTLITESGSAIGGTDFTSTSQTLSWASGDTSAKTVSIPIIDNSKADGNRQFTVKLISPTVTSGTGTVALANPEFAPVTIVDDESGGGSGSPGTASISASTASVAITGAGSGSYTITLGTSPSSDVVVGLTVTGSGTVTATNAADNSTLVRFLAGTTGAALTKTVNVLSTTDPGAGATTTATIVHTVSSSDTSYSGKTLPSVAVTVTGTTPSSGGGGGSSSSSSGGGAFGWSSLLALGSALLMRRRRRN